MSHNNERPEMAQSISSGSDYIALIHKEPKSDFGVSFPDFPGCISAGTTVEEAMAMAREALAGHIEAMIDEGLSIPRPSTVDAVMRHRVNRSGIFLPAKLVRAIDAHSRNRSRFLTQAVELKLESARPPGKGGRRPRGRVRRSGAPTKRTGNEQSPRGLTRAVAK